MDPISKKNEFYDNGIHKQFIWKGSLNLDPRILRCHFAIQLDKM